MTDAVTDDLVAVLPPLLQAMEALGFVGRYFHPPDFEAVMQSIGTPDAALRAALPRLGAWPDDLAHLRDPLREAGEAVLTAFDELRRAPSEPDGARSVYRALRQNPKAQELLYPFAAGLKPVSDFFLDGTARQDAAQQARLVQATPSEETGVLHGGGEPGSRGGFSLYVPETAAPTGGWPLVFALHGGSGNGRAFLWSWVRAARSLGAIIVAPTATGQTWALMGDDIDSPNLIGILELVSSRWPIDATRRLLTGMSDGGTFSYVSGLEPASPFTHLAPVAAAFHPMLAQTADPGRIRNLPIHVVHGALDWMFPIEMAQRAQQSLIEAGARVTYTPVADLSHCYPVEISSDLLRWLQETPAKA